MANILAIISKAVFEQMAPPDVECGTVVATDRYVSSHRTLWPLRWGGRSSLFLVTVRPPDERLWLVAILENPKHYARCFLS